MIKELDNQNFANEVLNNSATVLVDFYADWCGPCKMVAPVVKEIATERDDISVRQVNVDENSHLCAKYNIFNIPTLIVFKNGKETARLIGYQPKEGILAKI